MKRSDYYTIHSIVKAFRIIELLVTQREFELSELCRLLNYPKTTVHRILLTLQSMGYVKQNTENQKYQASLRFFEIGQKAIDTSNLIEAAHKYMVQLSENTGETVNLGILDEIHIVCIDKVPSKQALKHEQPIGTKVKAYCTSFGKAVLAFLPEQQRTELFSKHSISPCTSNSLKSIREIEREIQTILDRGYAVDIEEAEYGVTCVGAPIFDYTGKVVAGMSIAGPTARIKEQNIPHLGNLVSRTATLISDELGASKA